MRSFPTALVSSSLAPTPAVSLSSQRQDLSLFLSLFPRVQTMAEQEEPPPPMYSYEAFDGCCFAPTEMELLCYFLSNKIAGIGNLLPYDPSAFIPTVDLYGPASEPWRLCKEVAFPYAASSTEFYCFATRKPLNGSHCCRVAGKGTWSATGHDVKILNRGTVVGRRAFFSFKIGPPGATVKRDDMVTTHWVMYEYRLESAEFQSTVVCKIRNQEKEVLMDRGTWVTPWWEEECCNNNYNNVLSFSEKADEGNRKRRGSSPGREASGCKSKKQRKRVVVDNSKRQGSCRDVILAGISNSDFTGTPILDPSAPAAGSEKETWGSSLVTPPALVPAADALSSSDTLSPDDDDDNTLFSLDDDLMDLLGSLPPLPHGDVNFSINDQFIDPSPPAPAAAGSEKETWGSSLVTTPAFVPAADALSSPDTLSPDDADDTLFSLDDLMDLASLPPLPHGDVIFSINDQFMDQLGSETWCTGGGGNDFFFFEGEF